MAKGEISWKRKDPDGLTFQVYARKNGPRWHFYIRQRRFENWQALEHPLLEDWLALLDGVRRRAARRLLRPEEELRVKQQILEAFPDFTLE